MLSIIAKLMRLLNIVSVLDHAKGIGAVLM